MLKMMKVMTGMTSELSCYKDDDDEYDDDDDDGHADDDDDDEEEDDDDADDYNACDYECYHIF